MLDRTNRPFQPPFKQTRKYRTLSALYSLVVLALGIEYFGYESIITVFRVVILPLSVYLSCELIKKSFRAPGGGTLILICAFLAFISISTVLLSGLSGVSSALSFFFLVPFVCAISSCLNQYIQIPYSKIFFWWVVPHLLVFVFFPSIAYQGWSNRFLGLHSDSNFCGMYITFSLISCLFLLIKEKKRRWKLCALVFILIDAYLIVKTQSRTTLLTCAFGMGLLLLFLIKKTLFRVTFISVCFVGLLLAWGYAQTLDKYAGAYDNPIDNLMVRFSSKQLEGGSGREERYNNNFERISSEGMIVPVGYAAIDNQTGANFSHSSWIDLLLAGGGIAGSAFLLFVNICAIAVGVKSLRGRYDDEHLLLNAICLELWGYSMAFSMITGKLFWFAVSGICISAFMRKKRPHTKP